MTGTNQLFEEIGSPLLFRNIPDFDIEELIQLLGPRIVQTSGKDYAIAMHKENPSDYSDRTEYFDWHSDGLYHVVRKPPQFVLLHCLNKGTQDIKTELTDTATILNKLSFQNIQILGKLQSIYIGHNGSFTHPILNTLGMLLASRGYISPLSEISIESQPSIRNITETLTELYYLLDMHAVPYIWNIGDTLIFDQYRYMHRRNSASIDRNRKLIRMWFN